MQDSGKTVEITRWRIWLLASRPKTLTAAMTPVMVGTTVAIEAGGFRWGPAIAALMCALLIQVGTNIYNDVADYERGADSEQRLGPMRVTQAGLLPPEQVRRGAILAYIAAGVVGLYLAVDAGWPVVVIGLASILAGLAYTAGPSPLAYNGFGDLFVLVFFGFVAVCGTAFVQAGNIPIAAWPAGLAIGAVITALLVVNNVRDVDSDRKAGRRTLPVVFGRKAGLIEYVILMIIAYLMPLVMTAARITSGWVLLTWLSLPFAVHQYKYLSSNVGRRLNRALAGTSGLILVHGLLFAIGIAAGAL